MKKFAGFMLVLGIASALSGCGGRADGSGRPVLVTMLVLGNKPVNGRMETVLAEENKIFREKLNAELALQYIEWADWQTNYQLAIAAGDSSIDLIVTATDWLFAWEIARKGGFMPLSEELLKTNAPRTWAAIPEDHWDLCSQDGAIWFIPEDQYSQFTNHGMYWRKDWGARGGVAQVRNFEELEAYFDAVKRYHPEAYPWDVSALDIPYGILGGYLTTYTNTQVILGTATGNYNIFLYDTDDPYTVLSYMDVDAFLDSARMMDRWAKKGFWREDVLNYRTDTREMMFAGLSGADQHHTMTYYTNTRPTMDRLQPRSDLQFFYWGQANKNVNKDLLTHGAMALSAYSRNPGRALQVYDMLRNDKTIYMLHNYGIEGTDYVMNADGTLGRPDGWTPETDGLGTNFWAGRMDEFEPVNESWWNGTQDLIKELNSFAKEYPLGKLAFDNTRVAAEMAAIGDVCSTYIPALSYGKNGNVDKAVADFYAALKMAGYDKVKAEIQAQLDTLKAAGEK
ncbi:MAG: ABC transporter substrate-binding protein [Treponema sp.]|jgi:hypothetical protein|nr:ABC transporter substrate-binding protein [Treponema sp.]